MSAPALRASPARPTTLAYILARGRVSMGWWPALFLGLFIAIVGTVLVVARPSGVIGTMFWFYALIAAQSFHDREPPTLPMPPHQVRLAEFLAQAVLLTLIVGASAALLTIVQLLLPTELESGILTEIGLRATAQCDADGVLAFPLHTWFLGSIVMVLASLPSIAKDSPSTLQSVVAMGAPVFLFGWSGVAPTVPNALLVSGVLTPLLLLASWTTPWVADPTDEEEPASETLTLRRAPLIQTPRQAFEEGLRYGLHAADVREWSPRAWSLLVVFPFYVLFTTRSPAYALLALPFSPLLVWAGLSWFQLAGLTVGDKDAAMLRSLPPPPHILGLHLAGSALLPWLAWTLTLCVPGLLSPASAVGVLLAVLAYGLSRLTHTWTRTILGMGVLTIGTLDLMSGFYGMSMWWAMPFRAVLVVLIVGMGTRRWR